MTVEQTMLMVESVSGAMSESSLYFEVVEDGEIIEYGKYDEVCRTMDFIVDRFEVLNVSEPYEPIVCRIHL